MDMIKLKLRFFYLLGFPIILCNSSVAQKVVDVNLLTGAAQVSVPVGAVQSGDISFPLAFNYYGGGARVEDYGERYGIGWSFSAEAFVSREVRGFPDDLQFGSSPVITGWIRSGNVAGAVENFAISNDDNSATCSDEVTDYSYMNSNTPENYDTEPDMFTVNVPGLGFQFIFDKNQQIKVIPYRDVKVEYGTDQSTGHINSFTITNDKGLKYTFSQTYWTYQHIDTVLTPSTLPAFKRNYIFYRNNQGWVEYNSRWYLTSITDTRGNRVTFNYEITSGDMPSQGNEKVRIVKYNSSGSTYGIQNLYNNQSAHLIPRVRKISTWEAGLGSVAVDFAYMGPGAQASLTSMKFVKSGLVVGCLLSGPFNKTNDPDLPGRYFLTRIELASKNCATIIQTYKFSYYNVDPVAGTSYCTDVDSITNAQDYWGYFNGATSNVDLIPPVWVYPDNSNVDKYKITQIPNYSGNVVALTGSDRSVTSVSVSGSLKRIVYPNGGVTEIEYDNKEYFDDDVNGAVAGGGIRVRKISNNDGLNTNEVTNYDYNDPSTNVTTGKAVSIPDFCFAFPNSTTYSTVADKVKNSTYRTLYDYSGENKQVIYGKVTVRKTDGGKSVYEFNTSGTHGSANTGDWTESAVYITRQIITAPSPCGVIAPDFFTNGKNNYPFPVNANFDFERGLLNKVSNYNESGGLVSEESYTYQHSHSSTVKINALKFDDVGNVRGYAKYNLLTTQDNLIASHTTKTYNAANPSSTVYTSETETFTYPAGSVDYRLPVKLEKQNSDGSIYTTEMKYVKDYTNTSGTSGDDEQKAIHNLNLLRNNALIESYQYVQGSSNKYISGSLTTYRKEGSGDYYLPYESYKFAEPNGTTSFTPSYIDGSHNFIKDGKYFRTSTILKYDDAANPVSVTDNSRINKGAMFSAVENLKVAEFVNAKPDEVSYTAFDYDPVQHMIYSSNISSPGRYSSSCYALNTGSSIYGTINKATTNKNIVFSCWIKDASTSGSVAVTLSAAGFSANYTLPFTAHTNWRYYEIKMLKPSPSTITVTVETSVNLKIDDILVYPDNASIKTNSYTKTTGTRGDSRGIQLTAETGMGGTAKYYVYANNTMPYLVKDADENILQVNNQRTAQQAWELDGFEFNFDRPITWDAPIQANIATNIYANVAGPTACGVAITYTWNFGDGSSTQNTTTPDVQHTYATAGKYQVSCTLSATGYSSVTGYSPATTDPNALTVYGPPVPIICATGIIEYTVGAQCELAVCPVIPHPTPLCSETRFGISSVIGAVNGDIANWKWEKAPVGTSNWTTVADGFYPVITVPFSTTSPETPSYKVKCTVTLTNNLTGTSAEFTVYNNH